MDSTERQSTYTPEPDNQNDTLSAEDLAALEAERDTFGFGKSLFDPTTGEFKGYPAGSTVIDDQFDDIGEPRH